MSFGLPITEPTVRWWGARAIYKGYSDNYLIDLLYDRQGFTGDEKGSEPFMDWVNKRALPWLRSEVKKRALSTDKAELIEFREYKYILRANTNGSYGYLYIGVAELPVEAGEPYHNKAVKKDERVFIIGDTKFVWGLEHDPPVIGIKGNIAANNIGPGMVVGYQDEAYGDGHRLLNLRVELIAPPDWWVKQTERSDFVNWICNNIWALKPKHEKYFIDIDPKEKRRAVENIVAAPSAILNKDGMKRYKEWKQDYKLPPAIIWGEDFKIEKAEAA